jgi:hypothetical protein
LPIRPTQETALDNTTKTHFDNLFSQDRELQNQAFTYILAATERPVDWAYEAWDKLVAGLRHEDNHVRAIASQVLSNLAKSDPEGRMLKDFPSLLNVTRDERFVTARHCLQSLWKVGVVGKKQQQVLLDGLELRFKECIAEKNCTLIRYDILQGLRNLYDAVPDEGVRAKALAWIETEEDVKYRKKYLTLWKK